MIAEQYARRLDGFRLSAPNQNLKLNPPGAERIVLGLSALFRPIKGSAGGYKFRNQKAEVRYQKIEDRS